MTIQSFIEKVIEGGWGSNRMSLERVTNTGRVMFQVEGYYAPFGRDIHSILLDPLAWKAVGKVEGWSANVECNKCGTCINGYKAKMHRMIDSLAEGKSAEEYLATL